MEAVHDVDALETEEWVEALEAVIDADGAGRAHFLLETLIDRARLRGAYLPQSPTPPMSTPFRWSSNRTCPATLKSSIASARSSAGTRSRSSCGPTRKARSSAVISPASNRRRPFMTSGSRISGGRHRQAWRRPDLHPGPFSPGHLRPGLPGGRLSEEQLLNFRQEVEGKGLSSYPHPWLMPEFWQFPTVSMGLGPLMAIYQARFMKYLQGAASPTPATARCGLLSATARWTSPNRRAARSTGRP